LTTLSLMVGGLDHPNLSLQTSDALYCRSNAVDQESITFYFILLKKAKEDNTLMDKSCYIYSMDETGMPLDHKQPALKRNEKSPLFVIRKQKPSLHVQGYSPSTYGYF